MTTWIRLFDDLPEHPKVVGLSHKAFRVFVESLCYSSRNLTDGFVPKSALPRLHGDARTARDLVQAGLWETSENPHGYVIHDYLLVQRSREQITNERRTAAERMRSVRANKHRSSANVRSTESETDKPPNPLNGKTNKTYTCDLCAGLTFRTETRLQEHRENVHADYTAEPPPELDEIPF